MTEYLGNHFRYDTMNSWNRSASYACNLKIHSLSLDNEIVDKLYDLIQTDEFFDHLRYLIDMFNENHNYIWQAGMNGRSGGYLILYQGQMEPSGYKSFCTHCGQKNYTSIAENGNTCGRCKEPARQDFAKTHMRVVTYPGRGTDECEDFEAWDMVELKSRVQLIQEFDRLADAIVQEAVYMAKNYVAREEIYLVEKTRPVLVQNA